MTASTSTTAGPESTTPPPHAPAAGWVPADERVAGFDRRTIWPGVVLLVVWALWAHGIPWIDDQVAVDNPVSAGDVVVLGGDGVSFVPAEGWDLVAGVLSTAGDPVDEGLPTARLASGTVSYGVTVGGWDGSAEELVDQMIDINEGLDLLLAADEQGRTAIENADGAPGEIAYVNGVDQSALIATYVFERADDAPPIGVEIEVVGSPAALEEHVVEIASMIDSTTYRPEGQEATS